MEIAEINMIGDFEAGMKCLQNPSFISRFVPLSGVEKVPRAYSFWKWGALIFAIFAAFNSIIRRIKLVFIHFHAVKSSSSNQLYDEVFEFSEDDDFSLAASSDDDDDDGGDDDDERVDRDGENNPATTSFRGQRRVGDEDFGVRGSGFCLRQRNGGGAWSEFACGKNVVKLWDSLGLSLDFDEDLFNYDSESVVSTWGFDDHDETPSRFSGGGWNIPARGEASASMVLTAEGNGKGDGVIFGGYDTRMRRSFPALFAEWSSAAAKVAAVATGGVGKVYVRDNASGTLTVGDVRNVRKPLESVRETDGDTWWDADAVIVENESDESR
ncbi:hypothetical protein ABFS82_12G076900 [Erythranthe guttata]|uniref:Uncharacterized protein n=1 Tax=Erythranthe guttata TaxID=4155 RepID=A0A022RLT3_ERYGU|nr:PREDICTED: uncharacterized protein LOC105954204 [Erythranthe guttata]EYU40763.1 hypothetical protein MIMGU_mgv1a010005mg [Erythranthe guttata]|eukprot:XP_012833331.1 PREDICTED: uncharacterized protein LOC105954204 [Erythranthe guttata]